MGIIWGIHVVPLPVTRIFFPQVCFTSEPCHICPMYLGLNCFLVFKGKSSMETYANKSEYVCLLSLASSFLSKVTYVFLNRKKKLKGGATQVHLIILVVSSDNQIQNELFKLETAICSQISYSNFGGECQSLVAFRNLVQSLGFSLEECVPLCM